MSLRILVTGGAGFIGSHLAEALIARGDEVVCLDNFDPYYDPAIKRLNIARLMENDRFTLIEADIRDQKRLQQVGEEFRFDGVVHLAARAGVRPSILEPALYSDVNLAGTTNVLELARTFEIDRFVFASSSSVYGERTQTPFRETDSVDRPVSPYAATKKSGELLCYTYHQLYRMHVSCLRFFTVYGPRQRPEMAIHKFTRMMDHKEPITMFGDGSARRDFTYISDIITGVIGALDENDGYNIYNLGNHRMVTLKEMIDCLGSALGVTPIIQRLSSQPGDVSTTCADISVAQELIGYNPSTSFEEGIEQFVAWYRGVMVPV